MKRIVPALFVFFLSACSLADLGLLPPTPPFTETASTTPVPPPTHPTSTFTLTPTFVGGDRLVFTETPSATVAPLATNTVDATGTPPLASSGFTSVFVSTDKVYLSDCGRPMEVKFTVQAGDALRTIFAILYYRLKDTKKDVYTDWQFVDMNNETNGVFIYILTLKEIKDIEGFKNFPEAWIQYQLVGANANGDALARSAIFGDKILLTPCP